ncbi:ferritin-like domain-containing protein [Pedobacter hiemivivus]|uniref:Ferritin-like domain-containing protein n=1 Tax=Pedobacter hiemivivus TaxID=2530454 RepID=A0A4R0N7R1_9SPHI|nr:ferritin-like domain-containing protein [Pedobacter hiemivivus]TCC96100.1 ferritin-like domain-containing protein [Pedobacter hiemivivus]
MHNSMYWINYFTQNLKKQRIDWSISPTLTRIEKNNILASLQAWQLGETSEGTNLINAATKHAKELNDPHYTDAIRLFIKEEQKHGNNLGQYIDLIGEQRIKKDWGDSLFRKMRGLNTHMEFWTIAVITVESTAQIFYQCLKDATECRLLKQICTDILIDEAAHITFQIERLSLRYNHKNLFMRTISYYFYTVFYFSTTLVVWFAHKRLFKAGQVNFSNYWLKMKLKFKKTIKKLKPETENINTENTYSHLL